MLPPPKTPGVDPLARCKGAIPGNTFMVAGSCAEVSTCPTGYTTCVATAPLNGLSCQAVLPPARPVTRSAASVCRGAARRWRRRPAPAIGRADGGPAGRRAGRPGAATSSSLASPEKCRCGPDGEFTPARHGLRVRRGDRPARSPRRSRRYVTGPACPCVSCS